MNWAQHRFAVERARDRMAKMADSVNACCVICDGGDDNACACICPDGPTYASVTLQGEAASSDAEMLAEVADHLWDLDAKAAEKHRKLPPTFEQDWHALFGHVNTFVLRWNLPLPEMVVPSVWRLRMMANATHSMRLPKGTLNVQGVKVHFAEFETREVLRSF